MRHILTTLCLIVLLLSMTSCGATHPQNNWSSVIPKATRTIVKIAIHFTIADEIGQVLFSVDGVVFTKQLPLTNSGGWMVNGDGKLLVI